MSKEEEWRMSASSLSSADLQRLWPLTRYLKIVNRLCGYPFKIDHSRPGVVTVPKWEYIKFLLLLCIQPLPLVVGASLDVAETGKINPSYFPTLAKFEELDYYVFIVNGFLCNLTNAILFCTFLLTKKAHQRIYKKTAEVAVALRKGNPPSREAHEVHDRRLAWFKRGSALAASCISLTTLIIMWFTWQVSKLAYPSIHVSLKVLLCFSTGLSLWTLLSPLMWGGILTVADHIYVLERIIAAWRDEVNSIAAAARRTGSLDKPRFLRIMGLMADVGCLGDEMNRVLSPFVLVLYTAVVFFSITYFYGGCGIFVLLTGNGDSLHGLFAASNIVLGSVFGGFLYISSSIGQSLTAEKKKAVRTLEELGMVASSCRHEPHDILEIDNAISKIENSTDVAPFDFFCLNNGCLLGVSTTSVTYLIVLLQFRVG